MSLTTFALGDLLSSQIHPQRLPRAPRLPMISLPGLYQLVHVVLSSTRQGKQLKLVKQA
jgi:hypothetical protein